MAMDEFVQIQGCGQSEEDFAPDQMELWKIATPLVQALDKEF